MKIRNYECITMLKRNMQQIYVDEDWVARQYMDMEKSKDWSSLDTRQDNSFIALEQEIYDEENGVHHGLADIANEEQEDEIVEVVDSDSETDSNSN